jgi:gp32 DNA binding protein like
MSTNYSLDHKTLKAKLDKFNRVNTGANRNESLWRPTEGKHIIRIIPWKKNTTNPFIELYFHYLGNKTYLSPISYGRRDPISEFADNVRSTGEKEDYQKALPFMPKLRTLVPVIVRGEEEKGVRFYPFGKTVYKQLIEFTEDKDVGNISHPTEGRDIVLTYVPKEKSDTKLAKTTVMYKPNITPISADPEYVKKCLAEQPNIDELYEELSFQELKNILTVYLDPEAAFARENNSAPEDSPSPTISETAPAASKVSISDVLSEFDDKFGAATSSDSDIDKFGDIFDEK